MAEQQPSTGGFSHSPQPERDGFYHILHPDSGERLLLTRVDPAKAKASVQDWSDTLALQKSLGEARPTAWWPIERQGTDGEIAFAAFAPWKSTLSQDIAKGYRCNSAELVALAEGIIDGLSQLHSAAQRPHGALRPDCIVFPKATGDGHDSLAPRLTGLRPLDETDPRDHADRRRTGHLLYAAITGVETNFRDIPDFGFAWADVSLPGKNGWKKLIEDLTNGSLDAEPYDQIRIRVRKVRGGKVPIIPIVVGLLVVSAGVGGFLKFKRRVGGGGEDGGPKIKIVDGGRSNPPPQSNGVVNPGGSGTAEPAWLSELKSDEELRKLLGLQGLLTQPRAETAFSNWWRAVPQPKAGLWLSLSYKASAVPAVGDGVLPVIRTEATRRKTYEAQCQKLSEAQAGLANQIKQWVDGLGWNQKEIAQLIHDEVAQGVKVALQAQKPEFDPGSDLSAGYQESFAKLANLPQYSPKSFEGWSAFNQAEKDLAARHLASKWNRNLARWAGFVPPTLVGPEAEILKLTQEAGKEALDVTALQQILKDAEIKVAMVNRGLRLREYTTESEARKALEGQVGSLSSDATRALATARENKGNAEIAALQGKLQGIDRDLASRAKLQSESGNPRAYREAMATLRSNLAREEAAADYQRLSARGFKFGEARTVLAGLADPALVEEVNELVGPTGTNQLEQAIQKLAAVENTQGYPKAQVRKKALEGLRDRLAAEQRESLRRQAIQADVDRANTASSTARTNVGVALGKLVQQLEQLKSDPGAVTTNSVKIRDELVAVSNWLKSPELQVDQPLWTPTRLPQTAKAEWDVQLEEVRLAKARFQESKGKWDQAERSIGELDQFKDESRFKTLSELLNAPPLQNKPPFDTARGSLKKYLEMVTTGELLRTSTDTNRLKAYITELTEPTPQKPEYFKTLVPELRKRLAKVNEDAVAAAKEAAIREAAEAERKMKEQELKTLRATFVAAAKGVGGLTFEGAKYVRPRGVARSDAQRWKADVAKNRARYVALSSELDSSVDRAKIEKELNLLELAIQEAIDF